MSESGRRTPGRRTRRRAVIFVLLIGLLGLAWGLRLLLQPERMGALIVAQAESATGLRFEVLEPARLGVFPRLHLQLVGLTIRPGVQQAPLLQAERVDLALPLSVLWSSQPNIGRIDVIAPDIHLPNVRDWLAQDAERGPPEALSLPAFATEARITGGTLRADGFALHDAELRLSPLRNGTPASLNLSAKWQSDGEQREAGQSTEEALPFQLLIDATPTQLPEGIALRQLIIALSLRGESQPIVSFQGEIDLLLPQRIMLSLVASVSSQHPIISESAPPAITQMLAEPLTIEYRGAADFSDVLRLSNASTTTPIAISTRVPALLDWIADANRGALPPATGRLVLPSLDIEGAHIEGLRVELTPDPSAE